MGSCGLGTCTDPACYLCTVVAALPQPEWAHRREHAKYAEPRKQGRPALHPSQKKKKRKALEPMGLRLRK